MVDNDCCPLCDVCFESNTHLFLKCTFSQQCLQDISTWCGLKVRPITHMYFWKLNGNTLRRNTLRAIYTSTIYHIWKSRNDAVWNGNECLILILCLWLCWLFHFLLLWNWFFDVRMLFLACGCVVFLVKMLISDACCCLVWDWAVYPAVLLEFRLDTLFTSLFPCLYLSDLLGCSWFAAGLLLLFDVVVCCLVSSY